MDLLKDYDYKILHHLSKDNAIVDALSIKNAVMLATILTSFWKLLNAVQELQLSYRGEGAYLDQI